MKRAGGDLSGSYPAPAIVGSRRSERRLDCHHCGAPVDWTRLDCRYCNAVRPPEPAPLLVQRAQPVYSDYELRRALALFRSTS